MLSILLLLAWLVRLGEELIAWDAAQQYVPIYAVLAPIASLLATVRPAAASALSPAPAPSTKASMALLCTPAWLLHRARYGCCH